MLLVRDDDADALEPPRESLGEGGVSTQEKDLERVGRSVSLRRDRARVAQMNRVMSASAAISMKVAAPIGGSKPSMKSSLVSP